MAKTNLALEVIVVKPSIGVVVSCLVAFIFIGVFIFPACGCGRSRENARRSSCQSNLKQIELACQQYLQDYDYKYPLNSDSEDGSWVNQIKPYHLSTPVFDCPECGVKSSEKTDYFFNAKLAGKSMAAVDHPELTVANGDGIAESSLNYSLSSIPSKWALKENSPANRHLDGANYAFVDGHVKWFKPTVLDSLSGGSRYGFDLHLQ